MRAPLSAPRAGGSAGGTALAPGAPTHGLLRHNTRDKTEAGSRGTCYPVEERVNRVKGVAEVVCGDRSVSVTISFKMWLFHQLPKYLKSKGEGSRRTTNN